MIRMIPFALLAAGCYAFPLIAAAVAIDNEFLAVKYDDAANTFSVAAKDAAGPFVVNGRLDAAAVKAVVQPTADPVFGEGKAIVVTQADGSSTALELYRGLPFALLRKTLKNGSAKAVDFQKVVPASCTLELGKPAERLRTMGTGGLLPPDKNPGSYFFLTCADPATRVGVVAGWVTQFKGSGTLFSSVSNGAVSFKAQLEHGHLVLQPGQSATLDALAIGHFSDARLGQEALAAAVARAHRIKLRPKQAVYCSWYAEGKDHGGAGTEATTVALARFCAKQRLKDYGFGVIQIDDRWQDGPQIQGPATRFERVAPGGPYSNGIAPVAKAVEAEGLTFGLWWLPFGRNHTEPDFTEKQDWFYKWPDGKPLRQKGFGGTCLDASVPAVQAHLETLARTIRSWGVKYYKMDGISVGAGLDHCYINDGYKEDGFGRSLPPHDSTLTNIEVMRKGLGIIRRGAGDDVFFSGCCAVQNMRTYAGTIGLVDSMRVGPDFNHDGEGIRSGPLRGSRMYFLNGKVWWNDPDPTKVRTSTEGCSADPSINGAVTLEQARLTSSWVALADQFFLISDWLPNLPAERLEILKRTMASHGATARPVDYFDNALANTWLVTDARSGVRRDVLGLFNFYAQPLAIRHTVAHIGLDPARTYHAFDFWANAPLPDVTAEYADTLPANSCRVVALRAAEGHPVIVSTSSHVSQGMTDLAAETWEPQSAALSAESAVHADDAYEIRIAGLNAGGKRWRPSEVRLSPQAQSAGVAATLTPDGAVVRVTLRSSRACKVKWTVTFVALDAPSR